MKKTLTTITFAVIAICTVFAAQKQWDIENADITRQGDYLSVDMRLKLEGMRVTNDMAEVLTPCLVNEADTIQLPSIGIYGRDRYYYYQRRSANMITGSDEIVLRSNELPSSLDYHQMIPYTSNLNGAQLYVKHSTYGCCAKPKDVYAEATDADYREFLPWVISPAYVSAAQRVTKTDSLVDRAYVGFPVNRTEINPDFRNNFAELGKIRAGIDQVLGDADCTVTGITLKGYASPEGKYAHNAKLAEGRTEALKDYILKLYSFPAATISTDFEPEDWTGLREQVAASNMDNRQAILDIIDSDNDPDTKENMIRKSYPADYTFLLENIFPTLRSTQYCINYTIRHFTEIDEIREVFETQPRKLDLNELYLLASQYQPGTKDFNAVYEATVRMYPSDATANLNAANAALQSGNLKWAEECLTKAGNSAEAEYARGILALLREEYPEAQSLIQKAADSGIANAEDLLNQMRYNRVIN